MAAFRRAVDESLLPQLILPLLFRTRPMRNVAPLDRLPETEGGYTVGGISRFRPRVNRPAKVASPMSLPLLNSCLYRTSWCTTCAFAQARYLSLNDF